MVLMLWLMVGVDSFVEGDRVREWLLLRFILRLWLLGVVVVAIARLERLVLLNFESRSVN